MTIRGCLKYPSARFERLLRGSCVGCDWDVTHAGAGTETAKLEHGQTCETLEHDEATDHGRWSILRGRYLSLARTFGWLRNVINVIRRACYGFSPTGAWLPASRDPISRDFWKSLARISRTSQMYSSRRFRHHAFCKSFILKVQMQIDFSEERERLRKSSIQHKTCSYIAAILLQEIAILLNRIIYILILN